MADKPTIRVADFFCGCGGTSAGLRAAGMSIAVGIDFDPEAAATYRRNFAPDGTKFIERDIRDITVSEVATAVGPRDLPLLVTACAPCQPFSQLGGRGKTNRQDRTLLLRLLPFIEAL